MVAFKLSDCFKVNFLHLKFFGVWSGRKSHRYYKYYSASLLCVILMIYNSLLVINLVYTPRKIELIIQEGIFIFTEVTVMSKVFTVILMKDKLISAFEILDCKAFQGTDEASKQIIERHVSKYKNSWKMYTILGHLSYFSEILLPIIMHLIFNTNMELPICKYYFLDDGVVRRYFAFWFIYQGIGIYVHLQYNMNIDTLIAGLLFMAISQIKVLKYELKNNMKLKNRSFREDEFQIIALHEYLKNYEVLLKYCSLIQDIVGVTLFIQFGMASIMICIVLCAFLLPLTIQILMFLVTYQCAIVLEIFVPAWLGTQLSYESRKLVSAAYCSEWLPRSKRFKRSLKLFMVRANTNIVITAWRIFPLSLDTFTSIVKTAYSFFTLIRNVQERHKN